MNAAVALFLSEMRNQRDPIKSETGYCCPLCGARYLVAFGRRSKRWMCWHAINPRCDRTGRFLCTNAATEIQAIEMCRIAAEDNP